MKINKIKLFKRTVYLVKSTNFLSYLGLKTNIADSLRRPLQKTRVYKSPSRAIKNFQFFRTVKNESSIQNKFFERTFDKSRLKKFVRWFAHKWGLKKTISLLDTLKFLGFKYA